MVHKPASAFNVGTLPDDMVPTADAHIDRVARLLLDHAKALSNGPRKTGWIGKKELHQRTAQLTAWCSSAGLVMPRQLLLLIWFLLFPDGNPYSGKPPKFQKSWRAAARKESEYPAADGEPYAREVVSEVARAAFPSGGDHRRTIRDWRKEPGYRRLVVMHRIDREVVEGRKKGEMNDETEMHLRKNEFFSWCEDLTVGLRHTRGRPWGKR